MKIKLRKYRTAIFSALAVMASAAMIHYAMGQIDSAVYTNTAESDPNARVIVLDSGHGGMDGGCSTADGVTEKGINLSIMLSVRDMCRLYGFDTAVTRDRDISIHDSGTTGIRNQKVSDMENRLELFNKFPNAVCLSVHRPKIQRRTDVLLPCQCRQREVCFNTAKSVREKSPARQYARNKAVRQGALPVLLLQ